MYPIFLDTETTKLGTDARLVQLAYKNSTTGETVNELFKPPQEISFGSMAVHHITNEMVANKQSFADSPQKNELVKLLQDNCLVAHNAPFDINILRNEEVLTSHYVDTLRVAQHLIESEQYTLQYLRYFLHLPIAKPITPHDALSDIIVLETLYYYLENLTKEKFQLSSPTETLTKMMELSTTPILIKTFAFGKYVGKTFEEIAVQDRNYLQWLINSETSKPELEQNQNLVHTLKFYLS